MKAGTDYVRPDVPVSNAWNTGFARGLSGHDINPEQLAAWWQILEDPVLTDLIDRAVDNNLDLRTGRSRLRQARAARSIARSDFFPALDAAGAAARSGTGGGGDAGAVRTHYSASFDAGWEIDVFGGVRRAVEASEADLEASRENVYDLLVSLTAEVAVNYLELRTYQARLRVAEKNLKLQAETFALERCRRIAGLSDELAVLRARADVESTRARLPALQTQIEQAMNRIAVLSGQQPGRLHETLRASKPLPRVTPEVAVGVPADVLRRRPDVRRAERELAAQTARVGAARAELYPKFFLNGTIGFEAFSADDLFTDASRSWRFGPRITWPIFRAGAIRANIQVQSEVQEQALIQYESAVLSALEEVENALAAYMAEQNRKSSLNEAATAARQAAELARNQYDAGLVDFDTLLTSQRTLLTYQDELVQSEAAISTNLVRLYKALGGGWTSMAADEKHSSFFQQETNGNESKQASGG